MDDQTALEHVAAQWEVEYNRENVTIQDITCDGCLDAEGRKGVHCSECEIRACGQERGVINCAHCRDYSCDKLERLFGFAPDLRDGLEQIRACL